MSEEKKQLSKTRQTLVDRVLSRLDAGEMPWDNGMQGIAAPFNAVSNTHYRGINLLNLFLAGKPDPRWITFNQAKDKGYTVKKGAKGVPIELYKSIDKRTGKEADADAIREETKDMTFEARQKFKRENLQTFARSYYVFNASDVLGIEPYKPQIVDESARNERIEQIIANSEAPIFYDGNGRNYYEPAVDEIHLTERAAFTSDEFFYNTAFHEMAHSTGSRLKRDMSGSFGSKSYAREELVAEISSVLTAAELGLNHSERIIENSAEYVRVWAQLIRDNPQTLIDAAIDASRATDYICGISRQSEKDNGAQEKTQKENKTLSPSQLYKEYTAMQDKYPDTVIAWRSGDFYEVLGDKAHTVADEAGLILTGRNVGLSERVPMCGFPYHAAEQYLEKIRQNHDVAIVESSGHEFFMQSLKTPLEESAQRKTPGTEHTKPLVVNFYAGPGAGKSTAALELTAALKKVGFNAEYVSEYAKELVLEGKADDLDDQKKVTDEQFARLDRLRGAVDIVVTDSPVLLGLVYGEGKIDAEYAKQIRSYYDSFDNFNMLISRDKKAGYQQEGRVQNETEAIELDGKIKSMLDTNKVFYGSYKRDDIEKTVARISQTYNRLYNAESEKKTQKENLVKPSEFRTNLDNIPDAMKALPNWVAYRTETLENGKIGKILLSPNKGASSVEYLKWAKPNDPTTWATFEKATAFAKKYKLDGLAFAMGGSGITCIDLDHHLDKNGVPSELAKKYIDAAKGTYIERSVSGRGLHIFYAGERPANRQNRNIDLDLEAYDSARIMSMTGNLYGDAPKAVNAPSLELKNLLASNLTKLQQYSAPNTPLGLDDSALIEKIRNSKRGSEFDALWRGEDLCGDHSVSDFKLCNMLAFFSGGDAAQVERIFRSSGLYRPKKGDPYVRRTAEKACSSLVKTYQPKSNTQRKNGGKPSGSGGHGSSGR